MKSKSILFVALCFIFTACNNTDRNSVASTDTTKAAVAKTQLTTQNDSIVVAHIVGGVVSFVADTNVLKSDWQKYLNSQQGLSGTTLSHIEIIFVNSVYYLRASGTGSLGLLKSTMGTHTTGRGTECIIVGGSDAFTITCTTNGCTSEARGCVPMTSYCTPCSNKGKCTKTTSSSASAIFPSIRRTSCM